MERTTMIKDGVEVHAILEILDDGFHLVSPVIDLHDNSYVPLHICVCGADEEDECECGAWKRLEEEDDEEI